MRNISNGRVTSATSWLVPALADTEHTDILAHRVLSVARVMPLLVLAAHIILR